MTIVKRGRVVGSLVCGLVLLVLIPIYVLGNLIVVVLPQNKGTTKKSAGTSVVYYKPETEGPSKNAFGGDGLVEGGRLKDGMIEKGPNAAAQDSPAQDSPAQDSPAQDSPAQNSPAQNSPAQNSPAQNSPAQNSPAQDSPAQDSPAQDSLVQDGPVPDNPVPEYPVPENPVPDNLVKPTLIEVASDKAIDRPATAQTAPSNETASLESSETSEKLLEALFDPNGIYAGAIETAQYASQNPTSPMPIVRPDEPAIAQKPPTTVEEQASTDSKISQIEPEAIAIHPKAPAIEPGSPAIELKTESPKKEEVAASKEQVAQPSQGPKIAASNPTPKRRIWRSPTGKEIEGTLVRVQGDTIEFRTKNDKVVKSSVKFFCEEDQAYIKDFQHLK